MSRTLIIALAAVSLTPTPYAHAGGDVDKRPENTAASQCTNADGPPGKNNQGPGAGQGG
jgi:hypothetical protein